MDGQKNQNLPKLVLIGGGTGSFALLQELKNFPVEITALVNMADDGGSTGKLRDELAVLPPGDVRQCLVALSDASAELRELFNFRFGEGTLKGHSFGNLFLSAVEKMTDNFNDAVRIAGDVLHIKGAVLPVTLDNCQLVLDKDGESIYGQDIIHTLTFDSHMTPKLRLDPSAQLNPAARDAIQQADLIVIAPGSLYASLAPALLVEGLAEALREAPAKLAFVCNLVNKPNHTAGFAVHDYANEVERFIGTGQLDFVLYNKDMPSDNRMRAYALEGEEPVHVNEAELEAQTYKAIGGNFLSHKKTKHDPRSPIQHSLIRHDGNAVATSLVELCRK
jgi:uncharacterized cofD-like protein